jgi:hypothetical protein
MHKASLLHGPKPSRTKQVKWKRQGRRHEWHEAGQGERDAHTQTVMLMSGLGGQEKWRRRGGGQQFEENVLALVLLGLFEK